MILAQIAAMAKNRVIGKDNDLPWRLPEDLKFFKKMTSGKILIMGRKTFMSLPGHLPNRHHVVITRSPVVSEEEDVTFAGSVDEALEIARRLSPDYPGEVFIAGGGEIFKETLPIADKIYLTVIDEDFDGDAFFPEFPEKDFELVEQNDRPGPPPFSFRTYVRRAEAGR
ncbi:MAG: dihydrofolate reductase [Bdellovibrionaceae bacterium]|nr:dihydrofolate reductase [Pseudobdellovibrionaceae bacterium]MBX3032572.1 dihydrofolate reductase [Pseudobdellovibrionaceae bacterium]